MSLIQRNAVPLFILLAVIAVGVGGLLTQSPFAFGEEPVGCNVPTVGISILTTGEDGSTVIETYHGATINYQVILSIPELPAGDTACNYGGGTLSVTLPNGEQQMVAGTDATGQIDIIQVGAPFTAPAVSYQVDQSDANNMELTARADYSGGSSFSVPEGESPPEASSSISNTVRIIPPSIALDITPEGQLVYLGQQAEFEITVTNTGGFSLSNAVVRDRNALDCEREFATLAVGASETYQCALAPGNNIENEAIVDALVVGGVPDDEAAVQASDIASVQVETVLIGITMEPDLQRVRIGNDATFTIQVTIPGTTSLSEVNVSVPMAPDCNNALGTLDAGAVVDYSCTALLDQGRHQVAATVSGEVAGLATLTDSAEVDVEVFALDLFINIDPVEQTIREGGIAAFTITVGNFGDTILSDVTVTNATIPECGNFLANLAPGAEESYQCVSSPLSENVTTTATVDATAPDGGPVSASDSADVIILRPSTSVGLEELDTAVLRLVVQTLRVTETNDGDSPLTNICVELDNTGSILPLTHDGSNMAMQGEGMMAEGMEGDAMTADLCAGSDHGVMVLTKDSVEYVGGDVGDDNIMGIGETWEWRVVTVGIAGNFVGLADDALNMKFVAVGHGMDALGGDVTFPGDADELGQIDVPIVTR